MNNIVHYLGLDVHKETIAVSIAPGDSREVRRYGIINGSLDAVDKLLRRLAQPGVELRVVYEAGPCGFVLCRHLRAKGIACDVVAPSLIPKKASDKVKTDRRDADQLARLHRAGELTSIRVPDQEDEAVRDLIRARHNAMDDLRKARHRLKGFLLRLGFRYSGKSSWNDAHKHGTMGGAFRTCPDRSGCRTTSPRTHESGDPGGQRSRHGLSGTTRKGNLEAGPLNRLHGLRNIPGGHESHRWRARLRFTPLRCARSSH